MPALDQKLWPLWEKISADRRLNPPRQAVAAAILKIYLERGSCRLNSYALGKVCGYSYVTVSRAIRDLVRLGYLRRTSYFFSHGVEPVLVKPVLVEPAQRTLTLTHPLPGPLVDEPKKSVRLMARIERDQTLTDTAKKIARVILDHREATGGHLYRSSELGRRVGRSRAAVRNAKAELSMGGYFGWRLAEHRRTGPMIPNYEVDMATMGSNEITHVGRGYSLTPADKLNPSGADGFNGTGLFRASCGKCGAEVKVGHLRDRRLPPDAVFQMFRKRGWQVHQRKPKHNRCDHCLTPTKQEEITMPVPPPPSTSPAANGALPRALTAIECRKVSAILEVQFDIDRGRYEPGWDDGRVAIDANAPRASVTRYRDEAFGKLKTFDDIEKVLADLHTLQAMAEDLQKQVIVIRSKRLAL